jgi:A/G-specific adenine glycosylase
MSFAARLLRWYDRHGRKDLPWQRARTPYGVWVSEVMLQQTQVATVIPYFERFMARFPDVTALADAPLDAVLAHWSGLGYYSRARNLHRAAQKIRDAHGGVFPEDMDAVTALPGIGRSTAGAILAQALGRRHAILDGNVKRVLTRHRAIDGWPGQGAVERRLWDIAEAETPHARVADYTQAIMDLGATVCSRARPRCTACPVAGDCAAHREGATSRFPAPKPRKALPVRQTRMLLVTNTDGEVWLEKRPPSGIWGGLWSLPELPAHATPEEWAVTFGTRIHALATWAPLRHTFSHFHLDITPLRLSVAAPARVMEPDRGLWYKPDLSNQLGLPAPVARLLQALQQEGTGHDPNGALREAG